MNLHDKYSIMEAPLIYIGIDFSINKPAATIMYPDGILEFHAWPSRIAKIAFTQYSEVENVFIKSRNMNPISSDESNSIKVFEDIKRATELADLIINDIEESIKSYFEKVLLIKEKEFDKNSIQYYIATEGLSFRSSGRAALDLATYKGIFLNKIYEHWNSQLKGIYTYSPIAMKSVAGCAKKPERSNKEAMIVAFIKDENADSPFQKALISEKLRNKSKKYILCVDDLIDSYWALRTMILKEID